MLRKFATTVLRWAVRRSATAPVSESPTTRPAFNVEIMIGPKDLLDGMEPNRAVTAIQQAVCAISGAGLVSVEYQPSVPGGRWVEIAPALADDPDALSDALEQVDAAVTAALAGLVAARVPGTRHCRAVAAR